MATQATINITLDPGGAIAGLNQFNAAAAGIGENLEESGGRGTAALEDVTQGLGSMGRAAQAASGEAQSAFDGVNKQAAKTAQVVQQAAERQKDAETAAALAALPPWQRSYAQIVVESDKRIAAIDKQERDALTRYGADSQEYRAIWSSAEAQRAQATAETNGKIQQENLKLAQQLGGELETAYNEISAGKIGQTILANMKKLFFEILAEWMLTLGGMKSGAGGLLGSLVFGQGSLGAGVLGGAGGGGGILGGLLGGGASSAAISPSFTPGGSPLPPSLSGLASPIGGLGGLPGAGTTAAPLFLPSSLSSTSLSSTAGIGAGVAPSAAPGLAGDFSLLDTGAFDSLLGSNGALGGLLGGGLLDGSGSGGSLSTSSLAASAAGAALQTPGQAGGLLGSLQNIFSSPGGVSGPGALGALGALGPAILPLLGQALGGNLGMLGAALPLFAALNPLGLGSALFSGGLGLGIGGALGGGLLGFGVGENHGALAGALAGGIGGVGIGSLLGSIAGFGALGGPIGLAIAGIVGVVGGIFGGLFGGSKRKKEANDYFANQVQPAIAKIEDGFQGFQLDSAAALSQLDQLDRQAQTELKKLKGEGGSVYRKKVHPAIVAAEGDVNSLEAERNRRSGLVFGPAQFHDGGFVDATRSNLQAGSNEMWALLQHGEFVVNAGATRNNLAGLHAINAGGSAGGGNRFQIDDGAHFHFHSPNIDKSWLRNGGAQDILDALRRLGNEGA